MKNLVVDSLKDALQEFLQVEQEKRAGDIVIEILEETCKALAKWPAFPSAHHGYAVILEELDELKVHVFANQTKRDLPTMRKEAIQVAAMALRFVLDVSEGGRGRV